MCHTYITAVKDWGLDGLKLDFIDSFVLTEEAAKPDPRRDFESLEQAIDCLLTEITTGLYEINPDILIEFRQMYVGPSIRKYANMLRVNDCPADSIRNRSDVINLRLTSGKTAVHSDMLMWNEEDSPEEVACQLASVLYSVPQISLKLKDLPQGQLDVLKFYLSFWREHREILLDGYFTAKSPESYYSQAKASKNGVSVICVYTNPLVECCDKTSIIFNVSGETKICADAADNGSYEIFDCCGTPLEKGTAEKGINQFTVPIGGRLEVRI